MCDVALLLVCHGTPTSLDEIPSFLARIRGGRPASDVVVKAVRARYEAIGGSSPLLRTTQAQAEKLSARIGCPCFVATRMGCPSVEDALRAIAQANRFRELVVVSAAPHRARVYFDEVRNVAAKLAAQGAMLPNLHEAREWGTSQLYVRGWSNATAQILNGIGPSGASRAAVVFTAHSLPIRMIDEGDPYSELVAETASALTECLRNCHSPAVLLTILAYQSQGMSNELWLGPDLTATFDHVRSVGADSVVLVPIGFPVEHLETLYDLDIEARRMAEAHCLSFHRVPCLDADDSVVEAMCVGVKEVASASWGVAPAIGLISR